MKSTTIRIAGGSGDGIDSTSTNLAKALMRSGCNVFTHRHYPSRIRGGHTYVELRVSDEKVRSRPDEYDILLALGDSFARNPTENAYYGNEEIKPLTENLDDLSEGGIIIYDSGLLDKNDFPKEFENKVEEYNWDVHDINFRDLASKHGRTVIKNTAMVGYMLSLIDSTGLEYVRDIISEKMSGEIKEMNLNVLKEAEERAKDNSSKYSIPRSEHEEEQLLLSASHSISYGALDEGVQFVSGYPMTPWTTVYQTLSELIPKNGGVAEQVEDEITACCMAIGASHAGAKVLTGSSGGGFALMSESIGLAEMAEIPIVLVEAQRGGPATGLPTKPEQSDLHHVLYTSQGDTTRVVFAPGNIEEAYIQTRKAFELAYKYQLPSVILIDQKISGELRNVDKSVFTQTETNGGDLGTTLTEDEIAELPHHESGKFNRYRYLDELGSSYSPRSLPGQKDGRYLTTGNEHNKQGHIEEDPDNRYEIMSRRIKKLDDIREELNSLDNTYQTEHGHEDANTAILCFGSIQGTVFETVDTLYDNEGLKLNSMGISELKPFPQKEVQEFINKHDNIIVVEMNATAQFKDELLKNVSFEGKNLESIIKYNGNPFTPKELGNKITKVIQNE